MSRYLLTCECGKTIPVDVGQAGERVQCECGAQVEVPTLRKLRHLPAAEPEVAGERTAWNASKGVAAAGFILAALLAGYALWNRLNEPKVPQFDPVFRTTKVEEGLEQMSPLDAWKMWVEVYQPLANSGFAVFEYPHKEAIEQQISQHRILQTTLLVLAAVALAVAFTAVFWPRSETRRR
jgi:hypothetical protein